MSPANGMFATCVAVQLIDRINENSSFASPSRERYIGERLVILSVIVRCEGNAFFSDATVVGSADENESDKLPSLPFKDETISISLSKGM